MAYTTIDDPSAYFHTQLYTGTGSSQSITNDANAGDFQPDWIWIKNRTDDAGHPMFDSSRGVNKNLTVNSTSAESTVTTQVTAFNSDGFTVGSNNGANGSSDNLVAWQWKANGGTTASNTDGTITSTVQANTTAGFSIVTYTGNGSSSQTVGHGLGVKPKVIIPKRRDSTSHWLINDWSGDYTQKLKLNDTEAASSNTNQIEGASTTTFSIGNDPDVNANTGTFLAYCFAEKQGYSKFGSYTGNGSADGPFVYTGFKPAWLMYKTTGGINNWNLLDNKRSPTNVVDKNFYPDSSNAEMTSTKADFLSNGFKIRTSDNQSNTNGTTYVYMAFAEHPFVSSDGVPTTAR